MASDPSQDPAVPAARSGGKRLPGILGASMLLLGGGGWIGYVQLGKSRPPTTVEEPPADTEPGVTELEPFVLNLADPSGDRYLRLRVSLGVDRREVAERASAGLAQVKLRDRVLSVLSKKRAPELATDEGKEELRQEIRRTVDGLLAEAPFCVPASDERPARVLDVFFTEFLLQ